MKAQGVELIIPGPGSLPPADIALLPGPETPEYSYYVPRLREMGVPFIASIDPLTGLSRSLAYPRPNPETLIIGVDPGSTCGYVAVSDSNVLLGGKVECSLLGPKAIELAVRIPASNRMVFVGDGYGAATAVESLLEYGVEFTLVGERGSTSRPARGPLERVLKDKDLLASLTIALRGAYGKVQDTTGFSRYRGV